VPSGFAKFIQIVKCARQLFEPLKKLTLEIFWYTLLLREIWHYLKSW
jgi:hypothetical protein